MVIYQCRIQWVWIVTYCQSPYSSGKQCSHWSKMSLSRHEAVEFLSGTLGMPTVSSEDLKPTLPLLNGIIKHFQQIIPYQSVVACSLDDERRHLPSWSEIQQSLFAKYGGLCYSLNVFMKVLLESLGYEVVYVSACGFRFNDHVTVIVLNLRGAGSKDLVEVGCGYPTFQAFPLDFDDESPVYISGFLRHKFVKRENSIIWYHEPRQTPWSIVTSQLSPDGWFKFIDIEAFTPCDIRYFESSMTAHYTVKEDNIFLVAPRAVLYENCKLVAIKGTQLITETEDRKVDKKEIETLEELLHLYKKYFPQLPQEVIRDAVKHTGLFG
ncbi:uncharacterized protein [Apostichopus japonicus]|uniref:uncharacterized protein n=1 Tax=Stichopus japonicus TaxID=307972 RepID=UPI003AB7BC35